MNIIYTQPEWGFPKGRRNIHEKNIDCALREFEEESGIMSEKIEIMDRIHPLFETFIGTNNLNYKHSYYLSISDLEKTNLNLPSQQIEIGAIGWFSYDEAKRMIRPYHVDRLKILDEIVLFLANNLRYYSSWYPLDN
jgi:8-oxo-dGTP pyrophosphatase MutT (NUDIX family)